MKRWCIPIHWPRNHSLLVVAFALSSVRALGQNSSQLPATPVPAPSLATPASAATPAIIPTPTPAATPKPTPQPASGTTAPPPKSFWDSRLIISQRRKERMEDAVELERKVRREADSFWVQKMVLEPNRDFMLTFFANCEKALSPPVPDANAPAVDEQALKQAAIKAFNAQFYDLRWRVEAPLLIVNTEFACVTVVTEKIQDLMTEALDLGSAFTGSLMQKKKITELSDLRLAFFREIYDAQRRFTDYTSLATLPKAVASKA